MAEPIEVTWFDETEANAPKEAKTFSEMQYDNETAANGAYGKLEEIQKKVNEIISTVDSLVSGYETLKGKYDEYTGYYDAMDKNTNRFKEVVEEIQLKYADLDKAIHIIKKSKI